MDTLTDSEKRAIEILKALLLKQQNIQETIDSILMVTGWTKEKAQSLLNNVQENNQKDK